MVPPKVLFAALATLASASVLPLVHPGDGHYMVTRDEAGREVHTRVSDMTDAEFEAFRRANSAATEVEMRWDDEEDPMLLTQAEEKQKRAYLDGRAFRLDHTWCGCGINLHHGECDAATAELKAGIDRADGIVATNHYSIKGGTVAFACVYSRRIFSGRQAAEGFQIITNKCGWYVAGTWEQECIETVNNPLDRSCYSYQYPTTGYMRYTPSLDFCRMATSSNQSKC